MNEMWSEMTDQAREEYKDYFIRYHNSVAKTGITGKRIKPATVLPQNVVSVFEKAILTKVIYFMIITSLIGPVSSKSSLIKNGFVAGKNFIWMIPSYL